ncbi:MAG: hypothetical protein F6K62_11070 [Sphaerospermopsis sp. SIO1G2]|nr:hypothetical protein [Sphaerospermopsis sp. SIO1G2]
MHAALWGYTSICSPLWILRPLKNNRVSKVGLSTSMEGDIADEEATIY